jgi:hypothetical protein
MISPTQRPLPDDSQETDIHGPGGIRALSRSKRAAADPLMKWQIWKSTVKLDCNGTAMDWILLPSQAGSVLCCYLQLKILGAESFPLEKGFRLRQVTPYFVFPEGKVRPGRDADPSPPSIAEVKNRVELYLYSP